MHLWVEWTHRLRKKLSKKVNNAFDRKFQLLLELNASQVIQYLILSIIISKFWSSPIAPTRIDCQKRRFSSDLLLAQNSCYNSSTKAQQKHFLLGMHSTNYKTKRTTDTWIQLKMKSQWNDKTYHSMDLINYD